MKIPFHKQKFEITDRVKDCFETGMLSPGKYIGELETKFAEYVGSKYAVAVSSATAGIFLCLAYKKHLNPGRKTVYIPSATFASVPNSAIQLGYNVILDGRITAGDRYEIKPLKIYDSAHRILKGGHRQGFEVFSFYPTKILPSAEGGMITSNSGKFLKWVKPMLSCGRSGYGWDYTVEAIGYKMNMTNLQAAIALDKLEKLDDRNERVREIRNKYNDAFNLDNSSLHLYVVEVFKRKQVMKALDEVGIGYSVHFKPLHLNMAYKPFVELTGTWDMTSRMERKLSIPFHENLTDEEIDYIIREVKKHL